MRPRTLAEVAQLAITGESFDRSLANFLDEFYAAPNREAFSDSPPLLGPRFPGRGQVQDAYLAAVAEELSSKRGWPTPGWVTDESRKLHRPWFASSLASLRAVLILESPAAFRARNLFVSQNALSRV